MTRYFFSTITLLALSFAACSQPNSNRDSLSSNVNALLVGNSGSEGNAGNAGNKNTAPAQVVLFPIPDNLEFAGETVPLNNFDTRESLVREIQTNAYLHSRTLQALMSATRYFPVIEPILEKYGVPADFKYLCVAESNLAPNAVSSAGAVGLWQIMPATGKAAGLFIDKGLVDERFNVEKSTEVACLYLLEAKKRLGSWTMAAASYNVGQAGVQRRIDIQGVSDYYDLYLPDETMRYVFRIVAFKVIMENPEEFGYHIPADQYHKPLTKFKEITVSGANIDWAATALEHGTNYKMLRELNPWIREYKYENKALRKFTVRVPEKGFRE